MRKKQRPYKIWCAYDTETSNKLFADGCWYAWPVLYIFNDLHACDMARYVVDDEHEKIAFYRTEDEAVAYIVRIIDNVACHIARM